MARWICRLVTSGLRADGRWLAAIILSVAFALAALVPVQALSDASASGLGEYSARVIGADVRVVLDESSSISSAQLDLLIADVRGLGAQAARAYELAIAVASGQKAAQLRVVLVVDAGYPYYGRELWSDPPPVALSKGVALSTNAVKALGVKTGDSLDLMGRPITIAATFPENLLTLAASGTAGTAMASSSHIWPDASLPPGLPGGVLLIKLPTEPEAAAAVTALLTEAFGAHGQYHSGSLMPVVEVGLARLKQTFFWCALLIIFICAFGVSFGVEDYLNSKSDEIATLKMVGLPTLLVASVILLRLITAGVIAAVLAVGIGSAMTAATVALAGTRASDIADLAALSRFPWELLPIGTVLLLALGGAPLLIRLREKPHRVLWSKMRGAPLSSRTAAGVGSLVATTVISIPVMFGLARWYLGRDQTQALIFGLMAGCAALVLGLVYLLVKVVVSLRKLLPTFWSWPLTYLRAGSGRTVAATTAVALALAVGSGTALLDRAIDWELQAAVRKQVPMTVIALLEHGSLDVDKEAQISADLAGLEGVEASAYCDAGYVYLGRSMSSLTSRAAAAKAVSVNEAALFGSTLADHIHLAEPGIVGGTLWAEAVSISDIVGSECVMIGTTGKHDPPRGDPVTLTILGLDPRPGLRVGLNAPLTVPEGSLQSPQFRVLGVRADPAYSPAVTRLLEQQLSYVELHDMGAIEVLLRSAAEELSFVWWATSVIALLVSIVIFLTTSSVARMVRTYDLAMLRVIGISGRHLAAGPYTESVVQGVVAGIVGGLVACLAIYMGLPLFFAIDLPAYWAVPTAAIAVAVVISLGLCAATYRRSLARLPLEVLRSE
jgi:putative ABC transport system permease protein